MQLFGVCTSKGDSNPSMNLLIELTVMQVHNKCRRENTVEHATPPPVVEQNCVHIMAFFFFKPLKLF